MTAIGEFSLAIVSVGANNDAVGDYLYPVIAVATGLTSLLYPFTFRVGNPLADQLERRSPRFARQFLSVMTQWIKAARTMTQLKSKDALRVKRYLLLTVLNIGVVVLVLQIGSVVLRFNEDIANLLRIDQQYVGLIIGGAALVITLPATIGMWWSLRGLTDEVGNYIRSNRGNNILAESSSNGRNYARGVGTVVRDGILVILMAGLFIWSIPLVVELFALGNIATPITLGVLAVISVVALYFTRHIYKALARGLVRTFMPEIEGQEDPKQRHDP